MNKAHLPQESGSLVLDWVRRMKASGIRSIICLMRPKELKHYARLDLGAPDLIALYGLEGLTVCHIPWDDPAHRPAQKRAKGEELGRVRLKAITAFDQLPKPILLHCSAGIDRSSPVAAFVYSQRAAGT